MVGVLLHTIREAGWVTSGAGMTVTLAVTGVPGQLFAVGVMVKVTVTGALVVFVNDPLIFPEPLEVIPVTATVLSLVQLNVAPPGVLLLIAIVVIDAEEQIDCEEGVGVAFGMGLIKTVAIVGGPGQLFAVGITVKCTTVGFEFVNVPLISPVPLDGIDGTEVLSLVQL
jgi:hypothetical protein